MGCIMDKLKAFAKGVESIILPRNNTTDVVKKYPATFSRNDTEAIRQDWIKVGNDIRNGINLYEKSKKF